MTRTHVPVLAGELMELIHPQTGETAIDCTFGDGGHARLVAGRIGPTGLLVCIDRDPAAEERFEALSRYVERETRFIRMDYAGALDPLMEEGVEAVMAYLDLGVSSMQVDTWERGFSYSYDAPLDMRMAPGQELDARQVVNEWDERRLSQLFSAYGEERYSRQIARAIVRRRSTAPIETTHELVETIKSALPAPARFGGGHPAKRVFQAIRIAVNDELESLDRALPPAWTILRPGAGLAEPRHRHGRCAALPRGPHQRASRSATARSPLGRLHRWAASGNRVPQRQPARAQPGHSAHERQGRRRRSPELGAANAAGGP